MLMITAGIRPREPRASPLIARMLVVCLCVGSLVTLYFAPLVVNVEFNGEKFESPQPFQLTELTSQH